MLYRTVRFQGDKILKYLVYAQDFARYNCYVAEMFTFVCSSVR